MHRNPWIFPAALAGLWLLRRTRRRARRWDFYGRTVLITGGSQGLGLILARRFLSEGARVAICSRDGLELERARQDLARYGAGVLALPCDLTDPDQVGLLVDEVRDAFGRIDILVNNAGVIEVGPLESMTLSDFEEAMDTHFWGALYPILSVLPEMRHRRVGRIVNIVSVGGKAGVPHLAPYCASKFALAGLSQTLRAELARDGIWVTAVYPGLMRTGSPRNALFKGKPRAEHAWFSLFAALPLFSIDPGRAADRILEACRRGEAELVLSAPAKAAAWAQALFPELTADALALFHRVLPGAGRDSRGARGRDSASAISPSWLTALNDRAAEQYNETVR